MRPLWIYFQSGRILMADFSLGVAELGTQVSLAGLEKGLGDAESITKEKSSSLGGFFGQAFSFAAGGLIQKGIETLSSAVTGFFSGAIGDAREAAQVMAQTESVIRSTGGAAGFSAQQIADLASSLSAASGRSLFDDADIERGQNLLLTFTNIKETLPDATGVLVDMAQAMGTDVKSSAIQLGKALNDPIAGISALSRVGVTFDDQQKRVINRLVKTGDVAGAQRIILAELNKEFGGSAQAAAAADGGWAQFNARMGEAKEALGTAVLPLLSELAGILNDTVAPIVESAVAGFGELAQAFETGAANGGGAIGGLANALYRLDGVSKIFDTLGDAVVTLGGLFNDAFGEGGGLGIVLDDIREMTGIDLSPITSSIQLFGETWGIAGEFTSSFLEQLGGTIDLLLGTESVFQDLGILVNDTFSGLAATFSEASSPIEGFLNVLSEVSPAFALLYGVAQETLPQIEALVSQVLGDITGYFEANGAEMIGQAQTTWQSVHDTVLSLVEPLAEVINAALAQISAFWQAHGDEILATTGQIYTQINDIIQVAMQLIQATVIPALQFIAQFIADHGAEIQAAFSGAWQIISSVIDAALTLIKGLLTAALQVINGDWSGAWQTIQDMSARIVTDLLGVIKGGLDLIKASFDMTIDAILGIWNGLIGKSAGIGNDIVNGIINGIKASGDRLFDTLRNLAANALQAAKDAIHIGSPSRDFAEQVGEPIIDGIIAGVQGTAHQFYGALEDVATGGIGLMRDAGNMIGEALHESSAPDDAADLGTAIMEGLVEGIEDQLSHALKTMERAADQMLGAMEDTLGIHSPSQMFADIGEQSILGWLQGMLDAFPDLVGTLASLGDDLLSEAQSIADGIAGALQSGFEAEANMDRQKARNIKALEDIGAAAMETAAGVSRMTAEQHQRFIRAQLEEAEQAAAAMNDPEQAAKFYKMRSAQIFELAKLQEDLASAGTEADRNRIREQIALIEDAQQAELAAFQAGQQRSGSSNLDRLAEQLQEFLQNPDLPGVIQDASGVLQRLFDLLQQLNRPPPSPTGQGFGGPIGGGAPRFPSLMQGGTTVNIAVDARGTTNVQAVEEAGYRGAKRALDEAGIKADVYRRTRR